MSSELPRVVAIEPSRIEGAVRAPPSKSYTHRAIFTAHLAGGGVILNPLIAGDTLATLEAVRILGSTVDQRRDLVRVGLGEVEPVRCIDAKGSGTTIRIAMALASLLEGPTLLYGNKSLLRRPVAPLSESLRSLGAMVADSGGRPPVSVSGPVSGSRVEVDARISSQFVTALLMLGAGLGDLEAEAVGGLPSKGYINITIDVLSWFGVTITSKTTETGGVVFKVFGRPRPAKVKVPGDYSSASFIVAAAAIAGMAFIKGLSPSDPQPDRRILGIAREMGARVKWRDEGVEVEAPSDGLASIDVDLDESPDIAPVVAVMAAYAKGVSVLRGLHRLQYKESDRLEAIASNLARLGVKVERGEGTLKIWGGKVRGGIINSYGDHRIAMAFAVAGLAAEGPVIIDGFDSVADSYPGFLDDLSSLGAHVRVPEGGVRGHV